MACGENVVQLNRHEPTAVYRAHCEHGGLLYVGVTTDVSRRIRQHRADRWWWDQVLFVDVAWYPTRRRALEVEAEAIRREEPMHNRAGRPFADDQAYLEWRTVDLLPPGMMPGDLVGFTSDGCEIQPPARREMP